MDKTEQYFEDNLTDSRIVEKSNTKVMYDIRQMSEYIKKIGRPLDKSEANKFIIEYADTVKLVSDEEYKP